MNILIFKDVDLVISIYINYIENYYIIFDLIISPPRPFIKYKMKLEKSISVLIYFYMIIFVEDVKLFFGDYIFKLINKYPVALFIIVINALFYVILIRNNFEYSILLSRKL